MFILGGMGGALYRYSEQTDQFETLTSGTTQDIGAIWGINEDDIWAGLANGQFIRSTDKGDNWSPVSAPSFRFIHSIFGFSANDVWAVSDYASGSADSMVINFNGGSWTVKNDPAGWANVIWGPSASDLYLGGAQYWEPGLWHLSGDDWIRDDLFPENIATSGICGVNAGEVYVSRVGPTSGSFVWKGSFGSWSLDFSAPGAERKDKTTGNALWVDPLVGSVWRVAHRNPGDGNILVYRRDPDTGWSKKFDDKIEFNGGNFCLYGRNDKTVMMVGGNSRYGYWNGTNWTTGHIAEYGPHLLAVWGEYELLVDVTGMSQGDEEVGGGSGMTSDGRVILGQQGGQEVVASGHFPVDGELEVRLGFAGTTEDQLCYGGTGYNNKPRSLDGTTLHFWAPKFDNGEKGDLKLSILDIEKDKTSVFDDRAVLAERVFKAKKLRSRGMFPKWMGLGSQLRDKGRI